MKSRILFITAVIFAAVSCSFNTVDGNRPRGKIITASDNIITQEFPVNGFKAISSHLAADVHYEQGEYSVTMTGPDNVLEHTEMTVKDEELSIKTVGVRIRNPKDRKIVITISSPELNAVKINGAGDFEIENGLKTENLTVKINGAGDADIKGLVATTVSAIVNGAGDVDIEGLDCQDITVTVNGAGDVELKGKAKTASLSVNGAGDLDISGLECDNASTGINGAGKVKTR